MPASSRLTPQPRDTVPASLSVVVPTFRRAQSLEACLRALAAQTRAPEQIVVACSIDDQASQQLTRSLAREIPVELVISEHPNVSAQMNRGVTAATGDIVALTDDDAMPRAEWAARLLGLYNAPRVGAVGGRDVIAGAQAISGPQRDAVGVVTRGGRSVGNHHREAVGVRDVDFLKGVNLSVRRALWHVDEGLLGSGTQMHWELGTCLRIRRLGWRVLYDPELVVDHLPAARVSAPTRSSRDPGSLEWDAHNEIYELVRWLPPGPAAIAAVRAFAIGTKHRPGLVAAAWHVAHGSTPREALTELRFATAGRWRAVKARPRRDRWAT
jgi:cellulose synthase/poly-beta-1,6-N-acetylglucosamine synthase-like glycosyltransferase